MTLAAHLARCSTAGSAARRVPATATYAFAASAKRFASSSPPIPTAGEVSARTSLYDFHVDPAHGGKMVTFAGFEMPLVYNAQAGDKVAGGPVAEHNLVRTAAGLFDVGHMVQSTFTGPGALPFLLSLLPTSLATLPTSSPFRSSLSVLLNEQGGIIDDCMITRWGEEQFYLVTNAGRKTEDVAWIQSRLAAWEGADVKWEVLKSGLVALQGPTSAKALAAILPSSAPSVNSLTFGMSLHTTLSSLPGSPEVHIARGGYTGEDGFEISVKEKAYGSSGETEAVARALVDQPSVKLAGLAARDSLRLEAGLCLYGHDLDESVGVGEAGLAWVVGKDRRTPGSFVGSERTLSELQKGLVGITRKRIGLVVEKGAPAREGAKIFNEAGTEVGIVTSGLPAPTVKSNIAMGYVSTRAEGAHKKGANLLVEVRGKMRKAEVVTMPWIETGYYRGEGVLKA